MDSLWKTFLIILLLATAVIWIAALKFESSKFRIIACDVGQGDAILAIYGKTQVLTDGGLPNGKVISCLSKYIPFWDRNIELVINTHPQLDHFGGLIEVIKNYKVGAYMTSGLNSDTQEFRVLEEEVRRRGVRVIMPAAGEKYRLGLMRLEILWPSNGFKNNNGKNIGGVNGDNKKNILSEFSSENDPNDFSINAILSFGEFDTLLTGDIGPNTIDELLLLGGIRNIEYLKVPHHGSKNGLTKEYLEAAMPEVAVISAGKNNIYGHPSPETIKLLNEKAVKVLRTDIEGSIAVETDGKIILKKNNISRF